VDYLETKELLLVLDNCEHLVAAAAQLADAVLRSCARVQILATSREALRLPGERVWRVPSLSFPSSASVPVSHASDFEAVRLFVERGRDVSPFDLNEHNTNRIVEICRRLDGIPLALEMAAARLDVLTLDQLADRLAGRFGLLVGTFRTPLPRHETLRHTIDWSYNLLSSIEQRLFQRLSVFVGGFTLEAAESVCAGPELGSEGILETLSRLIDKSMVAVTRTAVGVRYHLLETLREYAGEKFQQGSDQYATRTKHLEFFLALAEQLESEPDSRHTTLTNDRAEQEHQNILAALAWCNAASGRSESALRIASALRPFWDVRCYHEQAKQLLLCALEQTDPSTQIQIRIKALDAAAYFLFKLDERDAARRTYEENLRLSSDLGDAAHISNALYWLAVIAAWQERHADAEVLQRRSLEISRKHELKAQTANGLDHLGCLAFDRGERQLAESYCQEGLELFRQLGSRQGITRSLFSLGMLAFARADQRTAESIYTEALALAKESGHKGNIAFALIRLGDACSTTDFRESRRLYEEALAVGRDIGYKRIVAIALIQLSGIACDEGAYAEVDRLLNEGGELLTQLHSERSLLAARRLLRMSRVSWERGQFADAIEFCQRVMGFEAFSGTKVLREHVFLQLGWIRLAQGERAGARSAFDNSVTLAQESGSLMFAIEQELGLGLLSLQDGGVHAAQSHFTTALSCCEARHDRTFMIAALLGLADVAVTQNQLEGAGPLCVRALRLAGDMGAKKDVARALCGLGVVASRRQRVPLAIRCLAAGRGLLDTIGGRLPTFHSIGHESALAAARAELGDDRFQKVWDGGCAMRAGGIENLLEEWEHWSRAPMATP
jgi:predicted ATPase